ncbi:DUF6769 family protein [Sphingobacterium lactis]|uniref:DUF6769 family protein n=1 Tax=Sphingobacterium lactis TaxID=797291 RepID=UPI003F7E16E4
MFRNKDVQKFIAIVINIKLYPYFWLMVKKISIVYLMILVQGFILAHSFVPHHHHHAESAATQDAHDHAHEHSHLHEHDGTDQEEHSTSTNIFDILFSNLHHSGDSVVYVQRSEVTVQKVLKKINKLDIANILQPLSVPYLISKPIVYESRTTPHFSNKYNLNFSLRGPPFFIV